MRVTHIPVGKPGEYQMMVAVTRDGSRLYLTNSNTGALQVVDTSTGLLAKTIPVFTSFGAAGLAITPDGSRVYVAPGSGGGPVKVVNTATNAVVKSIAVGRMASFVAVGPDGKQAYVANVHDGTVSVIATANDTVTKTIKVGDAIEANTGAGAGFLAVSPDSKRLYVTSTFFTTNGKVSVIDTATNAVVKTITVGRDPWGITVNPAGTRAYVCNHESDTVSVIDTATNAVVKTVPAGNDPYAVGVSTDGKRAYVTHLHAMGASDDTVSVIDTATNTFDTTVTIGPNGSYGSGYVAVDPKSPHIYAAPAADGAVAVICPV